jgi:Retrotransposon gag protein
MVSKSEFEKVIAELHAKYDEYRNHTDHSISQEGARLERLIADTDEQARVREDKNAATMINALGQQLQSLAMKLTVVESKLDAAHSARPEIRRSPIGDHQISATQPHIGSDKGLETPNESDFIRRESKFHFPRSECPGFNGDNPVEWLRKYHSYFELHQIPDMYKTHLATIQFHERASAWYDDYLIDHDPPPWRELVRLVQSHFTNPVSNNTLDDLKHMNQIATVHEYMEQFEKLRSRILLEGRNFSERDFMDSFISGLKGGIKTHSYGFQATFSSLSL